ncbi:ellis-van Creveld syndrome protein isoform X1 [Mauremys mutica]|uniref:ellis-van Creveld syndrome protein isoform X1 n=1 Tax=Mauremys mutica TaxID=74926 RepID=UPI001D16C0E3|nr:ellis-van Creveld syndrome protein isoform X1 [Mauremys mutica]
MASAAGEAPPGPCRGEIGLQFWVEALQLAPGLLAPAVLLGVALGVGAALLLCFYVIGPLLQNKKDDSQRLLESFHLDVHGHLDENVPLPRKEKTETQLSEEEMVLEGNESSLNSNITAFALKAKVVYPINQKFRPLADGSSNPSLHENPKQAVLPNQIMETSTSSSLGSLSHEDKEDCSSSTTIHSATSDDRFQDRAFLKVTCFPEVLTCESFDVKLCLYSLLLKELLLLDTELRREKQLIFIQVLRTYLSDFYLKKRITEDLYQKIILTQETDLEELQKQLTSRLLSTEMSGARNSEYQTLEDLERKEREYSEHIIDNMEAFWKQADKAEQFLLNQSNCSSAKRIKMMMYLTERMIAVEGLLSQSQDLQAMIYFHSLKSQEALDGKCGQLCLTRAMVQDVQERIFNWELMVKMINFFKTKIQEESKCRLDAVAGILDQLTIKSNLSLSQKEELLTGLHKAFLEQVAHCNNECVQQGKDLIVKLLACRTRKIREIKQAQKDEQGDLLSKTQKIGELDEFLKACHEMLEKQRQTLHDLEEEDDCQSTEAIAELHQELCSGTSHALDELVQELFLQTLPTKTGLSLRECELLKEECQENLILQLEKWDSCRQKQWKLFQEQLQQEKQLWTKEYALSAVMQKHLSEKHEKIIQGVLIRLGGLSEESAKYILRKHRLLLCSVLRRLAVRNVAMATLTHMKVSQKKSLLQELREQHTLQKSSSHCQDEHQWQLQNAMESHILEEEEKLEEETQQTRLEFHQQLVAEIQEALQLVQQHMEQVIGQALLQHARQEAAKQSSDDEEDFKERLIEAAVESVYVTSNGVNRLVQRYYQQIEKIMDGHENRKLQQLKSFQERTENNRLRKKQEENEQTLKEKMNQGTLNTSSAVHQRMLLQQQKFLAQFDVQQQVRLDSLKQKILVLHHLETQLENQLKQAEQDFITELAALARVPLTVRKQPLNRSVQSGKSQKTKRRNSHSWGKEDSGDFNEK